MTTYGVTPAGFKMKPESVIEEEVTADITGIPGLENAPTDAGSVVGNIIAIMTEREFFLWGLLLAVWQSAFRETSTEVSLDRTLATVFKSRRAAKRSTITLTLYNRTSESPVTVDSESQARQPATGVVWETTEEAEIPALSTLHSSLDIDTIEWQSGTTVRATFNGTPNLSDVAEDDEITISSAANSSNDGTFIISAIDIDNYWVEYANSSRTDGTDDEASDTTAVADIDDVETSVNVSAQSYNTGPFEATENTITEIVTPTSGWDAVTNIEVAQVGRNRETDDELRVRAATELAIAQGSTIAAIKDEISKVSGVTYASIISNRTAATDGEGNAPHSYTITVTGGVDQDIIDAIGLAAAGGIETNGSVSGYWTDDEGNEHLIRFERATEINPYLIANITKTGDYPDDGDDLVSEALTEVTFERGEDILNHLMIAAISNANIPGVTGIEVLQSKATDPPTTSANVSINADEVANITADRITVNSSP